jgi:hypothetical protein
MPMEKQKVSSSSSKTQAAVSNRAAATSTYNTRWKEKSNQKEAADNGNLKVVTNAIPQSFF